MKCEACLNQLEEYIDGELEQRVAEQINGHLITCADCSLAFEELTAEQEIYSRYDRGLEIASSMWNAIEGRLEEESPRSRASIRDWFAGLFAAPSFGFTLAGTVAVLLAAILIGVVYVSVQR